MIDDTLLPRYAASAAARGALLGAALMLVLRHPMRVALALIATMLSLGRHLRRCSACTSIAVFQVLIYVGAVMVFMVYVIMLLDVRDPSCTERYSWLLVPGVVGLRAAAGAARSAASGARCPSPARRARRPAFGVQPFSVAFLNDYWLHFELTSVLLVAAVVAALAVIKVRPEAAMDKTAVAARRRAGAVRDRPARRHRAPQRARHADVHGADAQRRQPEPGHVRASATAAAAARCWCS